ncbi:hypothetical protein FDA94_33860 [Herbidospora galbida]|uniref:Uncharacterized protein n=1 Tax=Herbidospora galbida TaxID=2575442 RepID=A0A4U3LZR9_9ACTN|nr:hypothetical protein [Herbidospora galbida]TKK81149.1 hypothetical protein FDA94_33860 [Herbidospora galbida]
MRANFSDVVTVQYGQFLVLDIDGADGVPPGEPSPYDLSFDDEEWFQPVMNGALVSTGYSDHLTEVRFELWDAAPPPPDEEAWQWSGAFFSSSGRLRLATLMTDEAHDVFDLGRRENWWNLRAIQIRIGNPDEATWESGPPRDIELYRLQFWPQ